jgi:hypothetical protein
MSTGAIVIASEAKQSIGLQAETWIASSLLLLAMTRKETCARITAARSRPEFAVSVAPFEAKRAQGMPGASCTRNLMCEE